MEVPDVSEGCEDRSIIERIGLKRLEVDILESARVGSHMSIRGLSLCNPAIVVHLAFVQPDLKG